MNIKDVGIQLSLSGYKPNQAAQASMLFGKIVAYGIGRKDGTLDIGFSDGTEFVVPVDPNYEAWELSASDGLLVVSLPGEN